MAVLRHFSRTEYCRVLNAVQGYCTPPEVSQSIRRDRNSAHGVGMYEMAGSVTIRLAVLVPFMY